MQSIMYASASIAAKHIRPARFDVLYRVENV